MIADMHVHSTFSPDGISTMEEQCIAALEKGERIICFTDHVDYNVAEKNNGIIKDNSKANFIIEEYLIEIDRLRKKYPELKILKGIEFSEPHLFKKEFERYSQYPFDYILGSVHHCYEGVFPGAANISEDEAIKEYYDIMIRSLEECFFDGMAHLDFPRSFFDHWNISETIINRILELMVEKSISLEINTSSLIDNNDMPMPDFKIIEKYSAIGGTRIVLGSDAHQTERIFNKFETVLEKLPSGMVIGYYENRIFYPL